MDIAGQAMSFLFLILILDCLMVYVLSQTFKPASQKFPEWIKFGGTKCKLAPM